MGRRALKKIRTDNREAAGSEYVERECTNIPSFTYATDLLRGIKVADKKEKFERRFREPLEKLKDISFEFSGSHNTLHQSYEIALKKVLKEFKTAFTATPMGTVVPIPLVGPYECNWLQHACG